MAVFLAADVRCDSRSSGRLPALRAAVFFMNRAAIAVSDLRPRSRAPPCLSLLTSNGCVCSIWERMSTRGTMSVVSIHVARQARDIMYLGIDLGTSAVKTILVDHEQRVVASRSRSLTVNSPHPGYSEQDPGQWIDATFATLDALKADHPRELAAVDGIGLSGQMHGATLLDANFKPLRPCILWNDGRSAAECRMLEQRWPALRATTGNKAMPGFTAPKLLWVAKHEPKIFAPTKLVLLPKAYLRLVLTGEAIEDVSDASGTLWLDVVRRDWSDEGLSATRLSRSQMPRLIEGCAPSARLSSEMALRWGMTKRPMIAGGARHNPPGAARHPAIRPRAAL